MTDRILCRHVFAGAARHFECTKAALTGHSRKHRISYQRQVAMHVCRSFGHSYLKVASRFSRDHTTVLYAVEKIEALCGSDDVARQDVQSVHDLALAEAALEQAVTRAHVARLEEARAQEHRL